MCPLQAWLLGKNLLLQSKQNRWLLKMLRGLNLLWKKLNKIRRVLLSEPRWDKRNAKILIRMRTLSVPYTLRLEFRTHPSSLCNNFSLNGWQGEATSAQLIGQAIANNPAFITLRKIEAAREIAHTISNSANKVFLDSSDLLLNLQKMELENPRNK